jgi:hypothetical protein
MELSIVRLAIKCFCLPSLLVVGLWATPHLLRAQTPGTPATTAPEVPDWAQPGSATHVQVPPLADFHRPSRNFDTPIGVFMANLTLVQP